MIGSRKITVLRNIKSKADYKFLERRGAFHVRYSRETWYDYEILVLIDVFKLILSSSKND